MTVRRDKVNSVITNTGCS
uniref:Uncharacterized protein n=1 Tax=Arundo donax TaxID=35708 RepID=A0A0A9HFY6_ARUDO